MHLRPEHTHNLTKIYTSPENCIKVSEFEDDYGNKHPDPIQVIGELIELDLIEIENDPSIYYLTEEGYEFLEFLLIVEKEQPINKLWLLENDPEYLRSTIENFGYQKYIKYIFISICVFTILVTLNQFMNPVARKNDLEYIDLSKVQQRAIELKSSAQDSVNNSKTTP